MKNYKRTIRVSEYNDQLNLYNVTELLRVIDNINRFVGPISISFNYDYEKKQWRVFDLNDNIVWGVGSSPDEACANAVCKLESVIKEEK